MGEAAVGDEADAVEGSVVSVRSMLGLGLPIKQ